MNEDWKNCEHIFIRDGRGFEMGPTCFEFRTCTKCGAGCHYAGGVYLPISEPEENWEEIVRKGIAWNKNLKTPKI